MLILTRRVGESLIIGDDIVVNVLGVKGNQVRIGVDAPKNVSVHREEIYNRINAEKTLPIGSQVTTPQGLGVVLGFNHEKGTVRVNYKHRDATGHVPIGDVNPAADQE